ncbi:fluoride efflux transporter CrcB [Conexibacter woesei]|uniref:fluoride efflux transporter CrcB n=1 Tax=Conexibacter woesei TaxID=191495 RepID=UPI0004202EFB|nr:fluoride efflux transporter CrcB [Conexibacter woesei]
MSVAVVLGVGALGGLGAVLRFLVDGAVTRRTGAGRFPFGTLAVNLSGALVLGVFAGAALRGDAYEVWGVGLIGGYTTFSTWMLESQRLAAGRRERAAAINIIGSVLLGVLAVWLGRSLG